MKRATAWVGRAGFVGALSWMTHAMMLPVESPALEDPHRPADQTFLTYPEWYLVHSPAEFAEFSTHSSPDEFPFWGHIGQFWSGYGHAYEATRGRFEFNTGYHVMVMVIGTSTTVEYAMRSAYETMVGRVSAASTEEMSAEDEYAAYVAQDYVDFINSTPFYQYPFGERLVGLWTDTPAWGPAPFRKWERRFILSSDYLTKAIYAAMIRELTQASYETPSLQTYAHIDRLPTDMELSLVRHEEDGSAVVALTRYGEFTHEASELARRGIQFRSVAGNDGDILVTCLVPRSFDRTTTRFQVLFEQPILTQPETKRVAVVAPVRRLSALLIEFGDPPRRVEHVYDY